LIPDHALALSHLISDSIPFVELDRETALEYLRKNEIPVMPSQKGWVLVRYEGLNLGWMKHLGNRINNYYPKEYRILMSK
jgi:NOL1/NOP2/fmu family ribosome biogenesis protein